MHTSPPRVILLHLAFTLLIFCSAGCDFIDYHPYAGNLEFKNLTAQNVAKIKALEEKYASQPSFQIAFISDTQGFFEETADMVKDVNRRNVAFVLHGGDLTNYAFTDEFERMHRALAKLQAPYVTVIGNHDCLGDGDKIYLKMYGPLDHSFTFLQNKFILLNTNYLEFFDGSVPDVNWLERELQNAPANVVNTFVLSHIAPHNFEANPNKKQAVADLMRKYDVRLSLHGHTHGYRDEQPFDDGIRYVSAASANKRSYVLITVTGDQATYQKIDF